jgi:hypothetical protein
METDAAADETAAAAAVEEGLSTEELSALADAW